jgi:hypothetical protein
MDKKQVRDGCIGRGGGGPQKLLNGPDKKGMGEVIMRGRREERE